MSTLLYNITSGTQLEFQRQESIAKNLAGSSLPGYRREFMVSSSFSQELNNKIGGDSQSLGGVSAGEVVVDFTQGEIKNTGRSLDFGIVGDGFFEVLTKEGNSFFTRNGSFRLSPEGELVTGEGHTVASDQGSLKFSEIDNIETMEVTPEGILTIKSEAGKKVIGTIKIVDIEDKTKLQRVSANYFTLGKDDKNLVIEAENYKILNNGHETANLSPVQEMATMISSLREFEMSNNIMKMQIRLAESAKRTLS